MDVLVTFAPNSRASLLDRLQMNDELEAIFGRRVDLVDRRALEASPNYLRRQEILASAEVVFGA